MKELRSRVVWLGVQTTLLILALLAVVGGVALAVYERAEHVDAQERLQAALGAHSSREAGVAGIDAVVAEELQATSHAASLPDLDIEARGAGTWPRTSG